MSRWVPAVPGELVAVSCWCDEHVMLVPRAVFDAGETVSCGDPLCCRAVAERALRVAGVRANACTMGQAKNGPGAALTARDQATPNGQE